jgi:hypothetical protein
MTLRFNRTDNTVVADTPEELASFLALDEAPKPPAAVAPLSRAVPEPGALPLAADLALAPASAAPAATPVPVLMEDELWRAFVDQLRPAHLKALRALKARGSLTLNELAVEMGLDSNAPSQAISGFTTAIKRRAVNLLGRGAAERIVRITNNNKLGQDRIVTYHAGTMLQEHEL